MAFQERTWIFLRQVKEIIDAYDFPLSIRQIFYQLVVKQILPNKQSSYDKVSRDCVKGRDVGFLDEDKFTDRLRQLDKPPSWVDLPDFMESVQAGYNKDKWVDQNSYIEIWSEKDALREVITDVTHPYDVGLLIGRGQVSRTAVYEAYKRFESRIEEENKRGYIYYFGDFDPPGMDIYDSLVDRIQNFGSYGQQIHFERIALTPEHIERYELPQDPSKKSYRGYKKFVNQYGDKVVELDALPPDVLKKMIRDCIESHIDQKILRHVQKIEEVEQRRLTELIQSLNITGGD